MTAFGELSSRTAPHRVARVSRDVYRRRVDRRLRCWVAGWSLLALGCPDDSEPKLTTASGSWTSPGDPSGPPATSDSSGSGESSGSTTSSGSITSSGPPTTTSASTGDDSTSTGGTTDEPPATALHVDFDALLQTFPDGCVGPGFDLDQLVAAGVVVPNLAVAPPTCSLVPGRGMGSVNFDEDPATPDTFPPGLAVDETTCALSGTIDGAMAFGVYAFVVTLAQDGVTAHLPYCAPQPGQPATAYPVERLDQGAERTLRPGLWRRTADAPDIHYGDPSPDPQVRVQGPLDCGAEPCFHKFIYRYNALSAAATVSSTPSTSAVIGGLDGLTHALRIDELARDLPEQLAARAFVVNVRLEYCIADNPIDCGNSETEPDAILALIREHGGGSGYNFSLVVLPPT